MPTIITETWRCSTAFIQTLKHEKLLCYRMHGMGKCLAPAKSLGEMHKGITLSWMDINVVSSPVMKKCSKEVKTPAKKILRNGNYEVSLQPLGSYKAKLCPATTVTGHYSTWCTPK